MSRRAPSIRSRMLVMSSGLVLATSLISVPVALAQEEGPDVTVQNLLAAIEAKDFEALPSFFCEEFAAQAAIFDLSGLAGTLPEGADAQSLLDAIILDTEVASVEVVSQSDTEAVVKLVATMSMDIDTEALAPFVEGLLAATGQDVTPEMVEMMSGVIASEFTAETTTIDEEITLVPDEAMPWLICDELGGSTPEASPVASPEASPAA